MKTNKIGCSNIGLTISIRFLWGWLIAVLCCCVGIQSVAAQTTYSLSRIYSFKGSSDGATPYGSLTLGYPYGSLPFSNTNLYGMTSQAGISNHGTVFQVSTNGTGFSVIHGFTGGPSDGGNPHGSLTYNAEYASLYGMAFSTNGQVVAFQADPSSLHFNSLGFVGFTLAHSCGSLALSSDNQKLYGMTSDAGYGSGAHDGNIFNVTVAGVLTNLHNFTGGPGDGAYPMGSLTLSADGSTLYGMTSAGGTNDSSNTINSGTIFKINANGTGYNVLHNFAPANDPQGDLTLSADGTTLYGMTHYTIFKMDTSGGGFSTLHTFTGGSSDGSAPYGSLTLSADGSTIYGMTSAGGNGGGYGTAFQIQTDGTGYNIIWNFQGYSHADGAAPYGSLTLTADGSLYGMTSAGGEYGGPTGHGMVFKLTPIKKIIGLSGNMAFGNVITGLTATATLTISNTGNTTLTVTNITFPSGFSGDWTQGLIPAGTSQNVTVTFAPTTTLIIYNGYITVGSDATSGTNTIFVSGTAVSNQTRVISLAGSLAFGNVTVGQTPQKTLTIWNRGYATMTVSNITCPGGFSVSMPSGGGLSFTIAANGAQSVYVHFSPTSATSYGGTLTVISDATSGTNTTAISGTGTAASYTISTSSSPPAGGTTSGAGSYALGTNVTVCATTNACYQFVDWTETGTMVSTLACYSFTATTNRTLVANFTPLRPILCASCSSTNAVLDWPTNVPGFSLLWTTNLSAGSWVTNATSPTIINGKYFITNPMSCPKIFYRLVY